MQTLWVGCFILTFAFPLQNVASIAGLMITTECVIADKPEEEKKMPGGMVAATCTKTGSNPLVPFSGRGKEGV